jgi:hypothetical protein
MQNPKKKNPKRKKKKRKEKKKHIIYVRPAPPRAKVDISSIDYMTLLYTIAI